MLVLKSMGSRFIVGYINLAEGEKDPRNLMVAFAIARVILIEFNISEHVEVRKKNRIPFYLLTILKGMFNILFCYFPITFRPPPNDKYGITTVDLRMALRYVIFLSQSICIEFFSRGSLAATPAFGSLAIPVFLEKISAGSRVTKVCLLEHH
jgi:DNA repair/transcription protein MET18/MMS19